MHWTSRGLLLCATLIDHMIRPWTRQFIHDKTCVICYKRPIEHKQDLDNIGSFPSSSTIMHHADGYVRPTVTITSDADVCSMTLTRIRELRRLLSCGTDVNIHVKSSKSKNGNIDHEPSSLYMLTDDDDLHLVLATVAFLLHTYASVPADADKRVHEIMFFLRLRQKK